MRREHPLWRGFWLAAGLSLLMAALGRADSLPFYAYLTELMQQTQAVEPFRLIAAAAVIVGACLAAIPRRIRRQGRRKTTLRRCIACLLGGVGMTLGLGLSGGGMLSGWLQGSVSAYVFALCAWLPGWLAVRLEERRKERRKTCSN